MSNNRAVNIIRSRSVEPHKLSVRQVRKSRSKLLTLFGTRPEVIKLASVIKQLETYSETIQTVNITSSQHTDLLQSLICLFHMRIDRDLRVMRRDQTSSLTCSRILAALDPILAEEKPDLILVQGDTTTALAGALAGFNRRIPVAHVEAGLRSGNPHSPHPEEINRRLITPLATYHFAPTPLNRDTLLAEGVAGENIFVTGNPVIDSLKVVLDRGTMKPAVEELLAATNGFKRIVLTTHRRESFGAVMAQNLRVMRSFVETHEDVALIFPVHPNPVVVKQATSTLSGHPRIHLTQPLDYEDFIMLLSHVWLIVSDSGGVQEEAPTLGKPLLILRENTERPEVVEAGVAQLVGARPERLRRMLQEAYQSGSWVCEVKSIQNPFGQGDSGEQIASIISEVIERDRPAVRSHRFGNR